MSTTHDDQTAQERQIVRAVLAQLKPFFIVKPVIFYADLVITGLIAWASLLAIQVPNLPLIAQGLLLIISYLAFYRGLMFIHETVHFQKKVPGLKAIYNLIFGFPCRVPFFIHDPHRYHHLPNTFGTALDPEYAYLQGSGFSSLFRPFLIGLLSPFVLALRFGVLPLVSWAFPKTWKILLYKRASTIIVNPHYIRPTPSDEELSSTRLEEGLCSLFFVIQIALFYFGILKIEVFWAWLSLMMVGSFINVWRARIAHRYDNPGDLLSPLAQLRDSITVESGFLSSIWAPAGMQYHSLHHLAPQIPFHNMRAAHNHLKKVLHIDHPYNQTIIPNATHGLEMFYKTVMTSK